MIPNENNLCLCLTIKPIAQCDHKRFISNADPQTTSPALSCDPW